MREIDPGTHALNGEEATVGKPNKHTPSHPPKREGAPRRVTGEQSLSQGAWRKMVAAIRSLARRDKPRDKPQNANG